MSDHTDVVLDFLHCRTPALWADAAVRDLDTLLIDHANCEKKAASTALNLMYRYIDRFELLNKMSRLAREELRHFEQVIAILKKRGIAYMPVTASRYAAGLHSHIRKQEPERLVDTLIAGAIIEARSCERFLTLIPKLDTDLADFYASLLKSEARHFLDYLGLAKSAAGAQKDTDSDITERVQYFLEIDAELVTTEDDQLRFHSGVPRVES